MTIDISGLRERLSAYNLHLLYAAESGSRAWGFESPDSDYDVRFIFAKSLNGYLVVHDPLETMRWDENDKLYDYTGWDLRKALKLAQNSNPSLLEWLRSPIVYADNYDFRFEFMRIMSEYFSPRALVHHYTNFARNMKGQIRVDWNGEDHTCKEYLYALRPILCIMWMQDNPLSMPPVRLLDVMTSMTIPHELKGEINRLLRFKSASIEGGMYRSTYLNSFITDWFTDSHEIAMNFPVRVPPDGMFNELFARMVMQLK